MLVQVLIIYIEFGMKGMLRINLNGCLALTNIPSSIFRSWLQPNPPPMF